MATAHQALYTAAQCRALDRYWIEQRGMPGYALMGRAAQASFNLIQELWPNSHSLLVLCGAGNNAGDGWIVARLGRAAGWSVRVLCVRSPDQLQGDAARAAQDYIATGGRWAHWDEANPPTLADDAIVVDALLGTGLSGPPQGDFAAAIEWANTACRPILALDLPSGLNADTGVAYSPCIQASASITFIAHKPGLNTGAAFDYTGAVHFAPLINEAECLEADESGQPPPAAEGLRLNDIAALAQVPRRSPTTHKGQAGHLWVLAGGPGMPGASLLAASAALRGGAGLVSVLTHHQHATQLVVYQPELMIHAWPEVETEAANHDLRLKLGQAPAVVCGPGLGQGGWSRSLFQALLTQWTMFQETPGALVLDADALNLLAQAQAAGDTPKLPQACVLTPHPGEAARLLGVSTADIQAHRVHAARELAQRYQCVVVLKGAGTVIARPVTSMNAVSYAICPQASGAMASAGMGDALAGLLGALMAQGMPVWEAALAAVCLHMRAASRAIGSRTRGVLASDLVHCLADVMP